MKGCPVEIDIPGFIGLLAQGKIDDAILKIKEKIVFQLFVGESALKKSNAKFYVCWVKRPTDSGWLFRDF